MREWVVSTLLASGSRAVALLLGGAMAALATAAFARLDKAIGVRGGYKSALSLKRRFVFAVILASFGCLAVGWALSSEAALLSLVGFVAFYSWRQLDKLHQVGISAVDSTVTSGVDYDASLRLCKNSMDLLGTGGHKITSSPEFASAMERCNRMNRPVRFLLSPPDNHLLEAASRRAGGSPDTYKHRVEESLRVLASLTLTKKYNIEVRFYKIENERDHENFRMLFIDDRICLLSYNFYDKAEGRELPQLILCNNTDDKNYLGFYYPFHEYFNAKWKEAIPWNPHEFLEGASVRRKRR